MLKLKEDPKPTFKAPVALTTPGGKTEKIRVEYRYLTQKQYEALVAEDPERTVRDTLLKLIVSWDDVDLAFDEDAFDRLADLYPGAPGAMWHAYHAERHGVPRKNS